MIVESTLKVENAVRRDEIPAGDYYMQVVKKGQTVRILDLEGNQAADTLFYSAEDPAERYSAIDMDKVGVIRTRKGERKITVALKFAFVIE